MFKKIKTLSFVLCAAAGLLIFSQSVSAQSSSSKNVLKTVIIDPGHGGSDPGARGLISTEAEVALQIAMKLGKELEQEFPEIKFIYTRTDESCAGGLSNI